MASLLRSSKYFKNVCPLTSKYLKINSNHVPYLFLANDPSPVSLHSFREYSVATATKENVSVEKWIQRLDFDVKKTGKVSSKELYEVFDEIRLKSQVSSSQSLLIIRCCGSLLPEETPRSRTKLVSEIWSTLVEKGVPLDISHYNALLSVYLENEHTFSPSKFLENLEQEGITPNRVTYQRLVAAYCQQGNINGATKILEYMKSNNIPISENIFNSLITGHSVANDIGSAQEIITVMKQANIQPSAETYCALLCAHARIGSIDGINATLETCASAGIDLNDKQFLEVIYALCAHNHSHMTDIIFPRLNRNFNYNQDARNIVLRLVSRGDTVSALKVLRSMNPIQLNDGDSVPIGNFMIKHMVKCGIPLQSILAICDELMQKKENERAIFIAAEASFQYSTPENSLKLVSAIAKYEPVCQHYYWPIIVKCVQAGDKEGIMKVLQQMVVDLNSAVPNETLREYVIEHIGPNEKGISELRQVGVTVASAASASVAFHLQNMDMASAAKIASQYRANYNLVAIRRGIIQSFLAKKDVNSFIQLLKAVCLSLDGDQEDLKERDPAGNILSSLCTSLKPDEMSELLKMYYDCGFQISNFTVESIKSKLGENLNPDMVGALERLTSPDLNLVDTDRKFKKSSNFSEQATLLQAIEKSKANGEPIAGMQLKLLLLYIDSNDSDQALNLAQELSDSNVKISPEIMTSLMDLCVSNENLSEAMKYYSELSKIPNVIFPVLSLINFANLLIKNEKFNEVYEMLEKNKRFEPPTETNFVYSSACWKLLTTIADKGDTVNTYKLFDSLKSNNFITPSNILLGPLIKVNMVTDNVKGALDKFEECCNLYRCTPWKNELARKLIHNEDAASLQKLTDLSTQIHGEVNSLYDLVLSFIECGRIRQARKILETPGLKMRQNRLNLACERYRNEGKAELLESLIEATKDINFIDRSDIYYNLLCIYSQRDDIDKATSLWMQMQEEDVQPTDPFLVKLANLLKKHDRPVPFVAPTSVPTERISKVQKSLNEQSKLKSLRRAVYKKDLEAALLIKQDMKDVELHLSDRTSLLNLLINNGRLGEASKMVITWLEQGLRPSIKALASLVNIIAKTGDINTLKSIGDHLDSDLQKSTSFTNRLAHCMVEAGQANELLSQLDRDLTNSKTQEEISRLKDNFPRGGIFSVLYKSPDLLEKFVNLEPKFREKGILEPANILWLYYIMEDSTDKARSLWNHIKGLERLMFKPILKKSRSENDIKYSDTLLEFAKDSNLSTPALGSIHSNTLEILAKLNKLDECESRLEELVKVCPLESLNYSVLNKVKTAFENNGRVFKYRIPEKIDRMKFNSSTSSSSDSDNERPGK